MDTRAIHGKSKKWNKVSDLFNILVLIGSLTIIGMLSIEILVPKSPMIANLFSRLQLWICLIFILDFFVRLLAAPHKGHFIARNFLFLLVSIPYLNLLEISHIEISRLSHQLLRIILLLRGGYGLMIVVSYITRSAISNLLLSYLISLLAITYFSSLFFYDVERDINPMVKNFADALYWASMRVTEAGSIIVPVTTTGRVLALTLAVLGLLIIPIGAAYVTSIYNKKTTKIKKKKSKKKKIK